MSYWQCGSVHQYDAPSGSDADKTYRVTIAGLSESCTCPDYIHRKARAGKRCKHIEAVFFYAAEGNYELPCQWSEATYDHPKAVLQEGNGFATATCPCCGSPATWIEEHDD
jgi:uncharacterized Zn-finger protein